METDITLDDANKILQGYDIGTACDLIRLTEGLANRNYKLTTTKGIYCLKICDEKTTEELDVQLKALSYLQENAFPIAVPIFMKNGQGYCVEGNLRAVVYTFLQGRSGSRTPGVTREIGFAMGKLHSVPSINGLPAFNLNLQVIANFLEEIKETEHFSHPFIIVLKEACQTLQAVNNPILPSGILHADLFPDNAIFDQDEKLVGVVDWEVLDIGMATVGCCFPSSPHLDYDLFSNLIKSYHKSRTLLPIEIQLIPLYIKYSLLLLAFWRFRQFNVRLKSSTRLNKYKELEDRYNLLDVSKIASLI